MNVKGYKGIFFKYNYYMKNIVFLDNKYIINIKGICFYILLMVKIMGKKRFWKYIRKYDLEIFSFLIGGVKG